MAPLVRAVARRRGALGQEEAARTLNEIADAMEENRAFRRQVILEAVRQGYGKELLRAVVAASI
jgi:hypothetical protein